MKRWQIVMLIITAIVIAAVLGGAVWYLWGPCGQQSTAEAWAKIRPVLAKWFDAIYENDLDAMVSLWNFSNTISVPQCMHDKMRTLNQAYEDMIAAKRAEERGDFEKAVYIMIGPEVIKQAGLELEKITNCAPFCR